MTTLSLNPQRWPLAFKAPLLVAGFMLIVSIVITNAVLARLKETQERHLAAMSTVYLKGLASAVLPHVLRDDIWEVFDIIDRAASLDGGFGRASVVVVNAAGRTVAASDPRLAPVMSDQAARNHRFEGANELMLDADAGRAHARRALIYQERNVGRIYVDYDVSHLLRERAEVFRTLVATNAMIALVLAVIGYWAIRRMLAPVRTLSQHLDLGVSGAVQPISPSEIDRAGTEFGRLFRRFNVMALAVNEREAFAKQLATEERLASLGRLASGMAHEINNPLGGLFNAIDTLKRHGETPSVRAASIDLVERGLRGIRDVVRSALAAYRAYRDQRSLEAEDIDDLRLLVAPEIGRRGVELIWSNATHGAIPLPASAVRQVLLNLVLNAAHASPHGGTVAVAAGIDRDMFRVEIDDQGPGMPDEAEAVLVGDSDQPVPIADGTGLGLWMTRRLVGGMHGRIEVGRSPLGGTRVMLAIPLRTQEDLRRVA